MKNRRRGKTTLPLASHALTSDVLAKTGTHRGLFWEYACLVFCRSFVQPRGRGFAACGGKTCGEAMPEWKRIRAHIGHSEVAKRGAGVSPATARRLNAGGQPHRKVRLLARRPARPCSPTGAQGLVRYTAMTTAR